MPQNATDTLWVLIAATLVMSMQVGFCMLEAGLVRSKNTINVAIKNLLDFCVASLVFWALGFAIMYGDSVFGFMGASQWFYSPVGGTYDGAFFVFQVMFAATAATIVSGAVAERLSFRSYLFITTAISLIIYPMAGHWAWNSAGWLYKMGFVDFAGSAVVHGVGGAAALAAVLLLGPRQGRFEGKGNLSSSHSLGTSTFGVLILFVAWLGFNGGSTLALNNRVPLIFINTILSGCMGGIVALILSWKINRLPALPATLNGVIAGLVAVTASCHAVMPVAAIAIGGIGGAISFFAERTIERYKIDDVVGASAAHAFPGIWGVLAVGIFGHTELLATGLGRLEQIGVQALGGVAILGWAFVSGWGLFWIINRFVYPLRVDAQSERVGLNVAEHGASTELIDLLSEMGQHRMAGDFTRKVMVTPFTEVGQIANEYNLVIDKVVEEMEIREGIAARLREEGEVVEESNRKIVSSIEYAQRIQQAMLAQEADIAALFQEYFIFYRPRDIVSGDFYWCATTATGTYIAVADCTGHGVPGAFMSIIGHNALQQAVVQENIESPDAILERVDELLTESLNQQQGSRGHLRDGMDVSLICLTKEEIIFAGARRPLYWGLPGAVSSATIQTGEIRGDRRSLGGGDSKRRVAFTAHRIPYKKGITLYLTSDGLAEQPNHLRVPFDSSRIKQFIAQNGARPMGEQRKLLIKAFEQHCGGALQRDDITLLAFRL